MIKNNNENNDYNSGHEEIQKLNIVLGEIKDHHKTIIDLKTNLESKANYIITSCGIIMTFILALISFMSSQNFIISSITAMFVSAVMATSGIAIVSAFNSLKVKNYVFPLGDDPKKKIFVENVVYGWKNMDSSILLLDELIESYIFCSKSNMLLNLKKSKSFLRSQKLMILTFIFVAVSIVTAILPNLLY